ncbi:MAG: prepilin-type N-terminal cleavage/methylation domain-containing protein [Gemmatimonadota bacterium]|nr:prepilin-type N-terminal cleavage/methylation domain-containing protein [Gemmatimonadota bacterium]
MDDWFASGRDAGFTLVEALIALVISGILASALISLLVGQSRFYERTDAQLYAEQTVRGAMDIMSSEIRMGSGTDLLAAEADSVSLRFDIARAIVCASSGSNAATALMFERNSGVNLAAGGSPGTAWSGPYETAFRYADGWLPTQSATGSAPKATCAANGAPSTYVDTDYAELTGWLGTFPSAPPAGAVVRFYDRLTYRFAPSTFFTSRTALWRGTQELIGPFADGAAFSYVMDDGSVRTSVSGSDLAAVAAVRVTATALGDGANRFAVQRPLSFDVPFRN